MTERVVVDGLSVAKVLHDFIGKEVLPGTGRVRGRILDTPRSPDPRPGAEEPRPPRRSATTCRAGSTPGIGRARASRSTCRLTRPSLSRSATSSPRGPISPSTPPASTTRSPASPARSSSCPSPTRAMRSTPPTRAGAACTMRSTARTRCPRTAAPRAAAATIPCAATRCSAWTKRFLDEIAPLAEGSHVSVRGYAVHDGRLVVSFESVEETWLDNAARLIGLGGSAKLVGLADPGAVRRLSRQPRRAARNPSATQRAARRDPDRQSPLHRQGGQSRRRRRDAGGGHHHHRRSGRFRSPPSIPTTRLRPIATGWA